MNNCGPQWFESKNAYGADWANLPQAFKDALYVTYTNFGKALMEKKYDARTPGEIYDPMPGFASAAGMNQLANALRIGGSEYSGSVTAIGNASTLLTSAQENTPVAFAYRYALLRLNPVVLFGLDYEARDQNGQLDLYNAAARNGTLTTEWIADRAAFLDWKNIADSKESQTIINGVTILQSSLAVESQRFIDLSQKIDLGVVPPGGGMAIQRRS